MINLFILGLPKAGTTSLHDFLCSHPDINDCSIKEGHFFNDSYGRFKVDDCSLKGEGIYNLDSSVSYIYSEKVLKNIMAYNDKAKFIFIHRDFVERAISHYRMDVNKYGLKDRGMKWYFENRDKYTFYGRKGFGPIDAGRYSLFYNQLKDIIPDENLIEIDFDDLIENWLEVRSTLSNFLHLDLNGEFPRSNPAISLTSPFVRSLIQFIPMKLKSVLKNSPLASYFYRKDSAINFSEDDLRLLESLRVSETEFLNKIRNDAK